MGTDGTPLIAGAADYSLRLALLFWGTNDHFFSVEGAKAYQRDIPDAELHLIDTGHFALENSADFIAERVKQFLGKE